MENLAGLNSIKIEVSVIFGSWAIWLSFRYKTACWRQNMSNSFEKYCCDHCYVSFFFQGMETMIVRYNSIVTSVKKKGYDLLDHRKGEVRVTFSTAVLPSDASCNLLCLCLFLLVWHWLWRIQTEHWWTETAAADVCWLLVWKTIVCKYSLFHGVNFGKCSIDAVCYALLRSGRIKGFSFGYRNGKKCNADRFLSLAFALFYQWKSVFRYFWRRTFLTFFLSFRLCELSNYSKNLRI